MINKSALLQEIIFESLKSFFIIGAISGVIIGLFLIYKPDYFPKWNQKLNHWYSSRKSLKPFEIMRETDSHVYTHNTSWGWGMLVGSGLFLYYFFTLQFTDGFMDLYFPDLATAMLVEGLMLAVWWFLAVFIVAGIPVWILLIVNPDLLKKVSKMFNRWLSTRLVLLPMEKMHVELDDWILKNNRMFGTVFILGSSFILFTFLFY